MSIRSGCRVLPWAFAWAPLAGLAADAERGAQLYLRLPTDAPACVSCHGPDPAGNRNNILRASDQPPALVKALGTVGVMGYLRPVLSDADIGDLAAYLGAVSRAATSATVAIWPRTIDFGTLVPGASSPPALLRWRNLSSQPVEPPALTLTRNRFQLEHDCQGPVAPGADCRISVRAVAGDSDDLTDVLRLGSPLPALVGVAARVRAEPAPAWVADAPSGLVDFGVVTVGETALRRVALRNAGTAGGVVGVAVVTGPGSTAFEWTDGCATAGVLMPGQACTLTLRFTPGSASAPSATVQWRGDGALAQTLEVRARAQTAVPVVPPTQPPVGGSGGGGGCAAAPPGRPGDFGLLALLLAAAAALTGRRRRGSARRRRPPM